MIILQMMIIIKMSLSVFSPRLTRRLEIHVQGFDQDSAIIHKYKHDTSGNITKKHILLAFGFLILYN